MLRTGSHTAILEYLERIHFPAPRGLNSLEPRLDTLQALHEAHLLAVPFENLSIHYGQPIILQEDALFDKIVRRRRGGFCYELNGLFAWLLRQLCFEVTQLSAEVANDSGAFSPPYDHLTLLVHGLDGADWLADVGFGDSFRLPKRFVAGVEQDDTDGHRYRLVPDVENEEHARTGYWILQQFNDERWEPQYRFTLEPHRLSDFTDRCYFQQNSPESHFTQQRVCSLATPTGRITLSAHSLRFNAASAQLPPHEQATEEADLRLITTIDGQKEERRLQSEEEFQALLAQLFGIIL
ncbi:MAG TPA: arylamine N-acetyltransferase [Ktedonobacteraceae bacterium]|nr:arylamine N-acetyltransferase [Ktedonobacteraceae bacterium]